MNFVITLNEAADEPLHRQLYEGLRASILTGRLTPGQRLPSTRALASSLGISRATVTLGFAQLIGEGYVQTRRGSGTFVSAQLPSELARAAVRTAERGAAATPRLSLYGESLRGAAGFESGVPGRSINFRDVRPAYDHFPMETWRKLLVRHCRAETALLDYTAEPAGYRGLREALARYLGRSRGVKCCAGDVIIVSGFQQGLDLAVRALVDRGDRVLVEDPGYPVARKTFAAQGAQLAAVPVDDQGLIVDSLSSPANRRAKLLYVTPSHQFPTGAVLPLARRLELLRWARATRTVVLEDDYDSAYRYGERQIPALQGLDQSASVVHIGSFSKVMFPALRIGYVVAPKNLFDIFVRAKAYSDRQSPLLEQRALCDFIEEGHFERHLRRMRALYEARRTALLRALASQFEDPVQITGEPAGMHLFARFKTALENTQIVRRAERAGVFVAGAESFYLNGGGKGEFMLSFAELDPETIDEGVRRLRAAFG